MNMIREIGISICVTAVAAAIFQGLMPKSSLEKTARFILSIFFLSCLIVPFTHFDYSAFENSLSVYQTEDISIEKSSLQTIVNQKLDELTKQSVSQTMYSTLRQYEIEPIEIQVNTTIEEDNSIIINSVIVLVDLEDYPSTETLSESLTEGNETKVEFRVSE